MAQIAQIKRPVVLARATDGAAASAHAGNRGLYGAIEWFGRIDTQLRALPNVQVAALYGVPY